MSRLLRFLPLLVGSVLLTGPSCCPAQAAYAPLAPVVHPQGTSALTFYAPVADAGARLPAEAIYPRGRKLAFMGYSGVPARDLTNGFSLAGPVYGDQLPYLERCFSNGWPVIAHIGPRISFSEKSPNRYCLNESTLRQQIAEQVSALAPHEEIVWWALTPEELRPWRTDEMTYLRLVCEEILKNDPLHRPIYHYNPNHRNASTLGPIAQQVDVLAKGCYVNFVGRKRDRAWVRWSIEQEVQALQTAARPNAIALLVPELCQDPEPEEDTEIRSWVRHDIYLGLACGAKGVLIWSLWPRPEVLRTWQLWYNAYAECARELNGPDALAQVFLFGQRRSDLKITQIKGQAAAQVDLGGNVESTTTSTDERTKRRIKLSSYTTAELAYGPNRWLFIINSANSPAVFSVSGWPKASGARNAFTSQTVPLPEATPLACELPAYGVSALKFSRAE
jgi:hypothetical protein